MWVCYYHEFSASFKHLSVNLFETLLRELDRIESKVSVPIGCRDIHPEHIYWYPKERELSVVSEKTVRRDLVLPM